MPVLLARQVGGTSGNKSGKFMRLVAFFVSGNRLDNYVDAFSLVKALGGEARLVRARRSGSTDSDGTVDCRGLECETVVLSPGAETLVDELGPAADRVVAEDPDIVFHCDARTDESRAFTALLRKKKFRGSILAAQINVAERAPWELNGDRLLCFGRRQLSRMPQERRVSAYAAGLPKLDRLQNIRTMAEGYAVFLGSRSPEPPVIHAALAAFEKNCGLPVAVLNDPDSPVRYNSPSGVTAQRMRGRTAIELIAGCNLVIGTDSNGVLDALYLRKPVVLLPNAGLAAFDGYPGISEGFAPPAVKEALTRLRQHGKGVEACLEELVGGVRYNHAQTTVETLVRLVGSGPLRVAQGVATARSSPVAVGEELPDLLTRDQLAALIPPDGRAAELGVAKGVFSDQLLRARPDFHLSSIDRWAGDRGHDNSEYNDACKLLRGHGDRCTIVRKTFDDALQDFAPESLDLIYIDGYAHDGQQSGKTLEQWWSRLRPGGIFAGHDYHPDWRPTMEAVDRFCAGRKLQLKTTAADFFPSWYVRKPFERGSAPSCGVTDSRQDDVATAA